MVTGYLVGQAVQIHACQPMVVLTCQCAAGNQPLLLATEALTVDCRRCGRRYALVRLSYDCARGPSFEVAVAQVVPMGDGALAAHAEAGRA